MPVAEEALLDPATWNTSGKKRQDIRTATNRAAREGVTATWTSWHDLTIAEHAQIREISEAWVADKSLELVTTPEGLKGKLIGVQGSTSNATFAKAYYAKGSTLRYYATQDDMIADLQSGRIDVMLADALTIEPILKSTAGAGLADKGLAPKDPLFGSGIGAAMRKGDSALQQRINTALAALKADGTYDQIRSRYFSVDISAN